MQLAVLQLYVISSTGELLVTWVDVVVQIYDEQFLSGYYTVMEEVWRYFTAVKVPIQQRKNTPLQVKVHKYYELDVVKVLQ